MLNEESSTMVRGSGNGLKTRNDMLLKDHLISDSIEFTNGSTPVVVNLQRKTDTAGVAVS